MLEPLRIYKTHKRWIHWPSLEKKPNTKGKPAVLLAFVRLDPDRIVFTYACCAPGDTFDRKKAHETIQHKLFDRHMGVVLPVPECSQNVRENEWAAIALFLTEMGTVGHEYASALATYCLQRRLQLPSPVFSPLKKQAQDPTLFCKFNLRTGESTRLGLHQVPRRS